MQRSLSNDVNLGFGCRRPFWAGAKSFRSKVQEKKNAFPLGAHKLVGEITRVLCDRDVRQTAPFRTCAGRAVRAHIQELVFNGKDHRGGFLEEVTFKLEPEGRVGFA